MGLWVLNDSGRDRAPAFMGRSVSGARAESQSHCDSAAHFRARLVGPVSKNVRFPLPISRRPTTRFKLSERLYRPTCGSIVVWKSNKHS